MNDRLSTKNGDLAMRLFMICSSVFVAGLFVVRAAQACSCAPPPSPREALEAAEAVFAGRVVMTERDAAGINEGNLFATIEVDAVWKGSVGTRLIVGTAPNSAMCGYPFQEGTRYIVYAHLREDGALRASLCTRTARLEDAEEDLQDLGDPLPNEEDDGGMCGGPSNVAAGQAMLFVFLAMALRLRRRRYER